MLFPNLRKVNVNVHESIRKPLHSFTLKLVDFCVLVERTFKVCINVLTLFFELLINSGVMKKIRYSTTHLFSMYGVLAVHGVLIRESQNLQLQFK